MAQLGRQGVEGSGCLWQGPQDPQWRSCWAPCCFLPCEGPRSRGFLLAPRCAGQGWGDRCLSWVLGPRRGCHSSVHSGASLGLILCAELVDCGFCAGTGAEASGSLLTSPAPVLSLLPAGTRPVGVPHHGARHALDASWAAPEYTARFSCPAPPTLLKLEVCFWHFCLS